MGVHAVMRDYRTIRRIVATLIALAVLAERAGNSSFPVRCLVLFFLRPAEAVARAFVVEATQTPRPALAHIPPVLNSRADAIGLAMRLRALATALGNLLWLARRFARWNTRIDRAARRFASSRPAMTSGNVKQRLNDTS